MNPGRGIISQLGVTLALTLGTGTHGLVQAATAAPITIVNPGFEAFVLAPSTFATHIGTGYSNQVLTGDPVPGWVLNGHGGTWQPPTSSYAGGVPEGVNVAWLEIDSIHSSTLSQVLEATLTANTAYTLSVDVGRRLDYAFGMFSVQLRAGGEVLAEGTSASIAAGTFETVTVSFTAPPDHPQLGQPLEIRLLATANMQQVNFDNVRLDATP